MLMVPHENVIPMMGIMLPLILVPTIIRMKHAHRRREWEHKERMRAMELGLVPPGSEPHTFWPSMAAIAIGAGVPVGAFFCAWMATMTSQVSDDVFAAATGVGIIAVVCGSMLAAKLYGISGTRSRELTPPNLAAKPAHFDPDAYDTVSQRG